VRSAFLIVSPDQAFDFVDVTGPDRTQDLPMLFLSNRQMIHKNLFQKTAVQPVCSCPGQRYSVGYKRVSLACDEDFFSYTPV
jgi:hypothetical protein